MGERQTVTLTRRIIGLRPMSLVQGGHEVKQHASSIDPHPRFFRSSWDYGSITVRVRIQCYWTIRSALWDRRVVFAIGSKWLCSFKLGHHYIIVSIVMLTFFWCKLQLLFKTIMDVRGVLRRHFKQKERLGDFIYFHNVPQSLRFCSSPFLGSWLRSSSV